MNTESPLWLASRLLAVAAILVLATSAAPGEAVAAQERSEVRDAGNFGVGFGAGTLAYGFSGKWFIQKEHALQFNVGVFGGRGLHRRFSHADGFATGVDYTFEMPAFVNAGKAFDLAWNLGFGLGFGIDEDKSDNNVVLGAAIVVGLEFNLLPIPLDIVIEHRPLLTTGTGKTRFEPLEFGTHVRYYF